MKLGVYNAILHDRPLPQALKIIADLGLTGIELNTGGFLPATHVPNIDQVLQSDAARDDFLEIFENTGVRIAGLNCNGNPLHPNPVIGDKHAEDVRRTIRLAQRLGQHRVVTMSGLPGGEPGATRVNWAVNAWNSAALDQLDYQYRIAAEFWKDIDTLAQDNDVKVALELHPQNIAFNPASFRELIERAGSSNIGVELDASHLFWQQMDPVACIRELGDSIAHVHVKDTWVDPINTARNGVLDTTSYRDVRNRSWQFRTIGYGHGAEFWKAMISELRLAGYDGALSIEHEDALMSVEEGFTRAVAMLRECIITEPPARAWWT